MVSNSCRLFKRSAAGTPSDSRILATVILDVEEGGCQENVSFVKAGQWYGQVLCFHLVVYNLACPCSAGYAFAVPTGHSQSLTALPPGTSSQTPKLISASVNPKRSLKTEIQYNIATGTINTPSKDDQIHHQDLSKTSVNSTHSCHGASSDVAPGAFPARRSRQAPQSLRQRWRRRRRPGTAAAGEGVGRHRGGSGGMVPQLELGMSGNILDFHYISSLRLCLL